VITQKVVQRPSPRKSTKAPPGYRPTIGIEQKTCEWCLKAYTPYRRNQRFCQGSCNDDCRNNKRSIARRALLAAPQQNPLSSARFVVENRKIDGFGLKRAHQERFGVPDSRPDIRNPKLIGPKLTERR